MSNSFAVLWTGTVASQAPLSMGFPTPESWRGLPFPSPGIFLTQGLNLHHPHWQVYSYHWATREVQCFQSLWYFTEFCVGCSGERPVTSKLQRRDALNLISGIIQWDAKGCISNPTKDIWGYCEDSVPLVLKALKAPSVFSGKKHTFSHRLTINTIICTSFSI